MSKRLLISAQLVRDSLQALCSFRRWFSRHEGIGYWLGLERGDLTVASSLVIPYAETSPGHFHVPARENARVTNTAHAHRLIVVAQVHSHPGTRVHHSQGDNRDAFMPSDGYYSLIVPNYARGDPSIQSWGVHRYERGHFYRLSPAEVAAQVTVVPNVVDLR